MAVSIPPFITSANITGSTLISNADNQLNILMNDVEAYVENTYQTIATELEGTVGIHVTTASNFAIQAEASASVSEASALSASVSEDNALIYKNSAEASALSASVSEDNALIYKNSAEASALSASTSAYDAATNATAVANHLANVSNPHNTTALQVGLGNVTNTSDYAKPVIGFTLNNATPPNAGQLAWNAADETLDLGLDGEVTLQVGQELLVRGKNTTGVTIPNGRVLMATGAVGNSGVISIGLHNGVQATGYRIAGISTEDIASNEIGFSVLRGKLRGINCTGTPYGETWANGDGLWVSPNGNGAMTNIEPMSTQLKMFVGVVVNNTTNGTIQVRTNGIDEHHSEANIALKASLNQVTALALALGLTQGQIDTILANNP